MGLGLDDYLHISIDLPEGLQVRVGECTAFVVSFAQEEGKLIIPSRPGTGKSELVRELTNEVSLVGLFHQSASLLFRSEVGGTQKELAALWSQAQLKPYLLHYIFFNEFHSLASNREQAGSCLLIVFVTATQVPVGTP